MRAWLFSIAACVLCACSEDTRPPPGDPGSDAGEDAGGQPDAGPKPDAGAQSDAGQDAGPQPDAGPDAASPLSPLERPLELPRPPGSRLPDDLKPPVR